MKKIIYLLTLLLLIGCYKDTEFFVEDSSKTEQFVKTSFAGIVTDDSGGPVAGASIILGSRQTETDINGVYFLDNTSVNVKQAFVKVSKPGFYESSRALIAKVNTQINSNFILTRKQEIGTFAATAGETFSLPDGAVLEVPADGITDFTGDATLYVNTWDLTDLDLSLQMPGNFTGEDENGEQKSLIPYGMLVMTASDNSGANLNIAANKTFRISIPVADNNPPSVAALWLFDELDGVWKQKGTATLEGQFYVAAVSEFGHWAIADLADIVNVSGIVTKDDEPVGNILIALSSLNNGITRFTYTDSRGFYNFRTAANTSVKAGPYSRACTDFTVSQSIEIAEDDLENQDFSVNNQITVYSGQAMDCNKNPQMNGYAIVADQLVVKLDDQGRFSGTILDACQANLTFRTFDARSQENALIAKPENFSPVQVHLVTCEGLSEYTNLNYDNRSLLLSVAAEANLQPAGSNEDGAIAINDETIGTLIFNFRGDSEGAYPVNSMEFSDQLNGENFEIESVEIEITLNETVQTGETLTGSFAGNFLDSNGATHSLSGDFSVIKDN